MTSHYFIKQFSDCLLFVNIGLKLWFQTYARAKLFYSQSSQHIGNFFDVQIV
jgi:hypothetical protein